MAAKHGIDVELLKRELLRLDISYERLAKLLGMSRSALERQLHRRTRPRWYLRESIEHILGIERGRILRSRSAAQYRMLGALIASRALH
jgi:transcriptional regulator with XRE-family HTH domain